MRLLLTTSYGHLPDVIGGLQTTLHELCLALVARGVEPTVLCGYAATLHKEHATARSDEILGYPVIRMPNPEEALSTVAAVSQPDAIMVLTGDKTATMIIAALDTDLPVAAYIHNVEFREFGGVLLPDPAICYFSNSIFTARRLQSLFGLQSTVLLPLVQRENYQLEPDRKKVIFINPSLLKGLEIFFRVAEQLPELPFRVFESWNLTNAWRKYCLSRATELANVEWCSPTRDITQIYGAARLLLMPSIWEEAYGRSAIEAQVSGIPVIASRRGGLPESVGDGGLLLEPDAEISDWVHAVQTAYTNQTLYDELSAKASSNASRVEISADFLVATLMTVLKAHISSIR